jgi:hypothetical protein
MLTKFIVMLYMCVGADCGFVHTKATFNTLSQCESALKQALKDFEGTDRLDGVCIKLPAEREA